MELEEEPVTADLTSTNVFPSFGAGRTSFDFRAADKMPNAMLDRARRSRANRMEIWLVA